jgi:hypothetical protein
MRDARRISKEDDFNQIVATNPVSYGHTMITEIATQSFSLRDIRTLILVEGGDRDGIHLQITLGLPFAA